MDYEKENEKNKNEIKEQESPVTSIKIKEAIAILKKYNVDCKNNKIKKTINLFLNILDGDRYDKHIGFAKQRNKLLNIIKKIKEIEKIKEPNTDEIQQINKIIEQLHNLPIEKDVLQSYDNVIEKIIEFSKGKKSSLYIQCQKSKIDEAIEYFSDYEYMKHMSNSKQDKISIHFIVPIYIITTIIYHGKLYPNKLPQNTMKIQNFKENTIALEKPTGTYNKTKNYFIKLVDNIKKKIVTSDIFNTNGFMGSFLKNIVSTYDYPGRGTFPTITYKRKVDKTYKIKKFINHMENVFKYLEGIDKIGFSNFLNRGDNINFKKSFFDAVLNFSNKYKFEFGPLFKNKQSVFFNFHSNLIEKFKLKNSSSRNKRLIKQRKNDIPPPPPSSSIKLPPPPSTTLKNLQQQNKTKRKTPLRVQTPNLGQKKINNTLSTKKDEFSEEQKKRAMGVTRKLPPIVKTDMSELKKKAAQWEKNKKNKKNNKPAWNSSGNNGFERGQFYNDGTRMDQGRRRRRRRKYGGNKTKKKKRKKRNTTTNKKKNKKKKYTKRYNKKHNKKRNNKKRYTKKNK